MFGKLIQSSCEDFKSEVKLTHNSWVKTPAAADENKIIPDFTNLYINYKSTGEWYNQVVKKDTTIIALATALKKEQKKNKHSHLNSNVNYLANAKKSSAVIPKWSFTKTDTLKT